MALGDRSAWRLRTEQRIADLPDTLFDGLVPPTAYANTAEYRSLEGRYYNAAYLTLVDMWQDPVAFVPIYRVGKPLTDGYDPTALFGLRKAEQLLLFGSVRGFVNHLAFAEGLTPVQRGQATAQLIDAATAIADEHGASQVLAPCLDRVQAAAVDLACPGRVRHVEPRAVVDLTWPSFEAYRRSLSKNGRKVVRREREAFEPLRAGLVDRPFAEVASEIMPLLEQVERKHGSALTSLAIEWHMRAVHKPMGERARALLLTIDGRPVAVSTVWQHEREWHVRAWGCDYDLAGDLPLYGNLVFYEPIERAIRAGATAVHLGTQALEPKRRRGARIEDLTSILIKPAQHG